MKVIERSEVPTSQPQDQVISHAEKPNEGEVGKGDDPRSIGDVPQDLLGNFRIAYNVSLRGNKSRLETY